MNPAAVMDRVVYVASGRAASGSTEEVVREDVLSALVRPSCDVLHLEDRILVVAGKDEGHHAELESNNTTPAPEDSRDRGGAILTGMSNRACSRANLSVWR